MTRVASTRKTKTRKTAGAFDRAGVVFVVSFAAMVEIAALMGPAPHLQRARPPELAAPTLLIVGPGHLDDLFAQLEPGRAASRFVALGEVGVHQLLDAYHRLGYFLVAIRKKAHPVPRLYLSNLPDDLDEIDIVTTRKSLFLRTVLPLVLRENERISEDRARILAISDRIAGRITDGDEASEMETAWVSDLAARYGLEAPASGPTDGAFLDQLLFRVDIVPASLALAQAIAESGWGTSRFAREGNALFGLRTWKEKAGLVPQARGSDESHLVRRYESLAESVASYMRNLNMGERYEGFRRTRHKMRTAGLKPTGPALVGEIGAYSERGEGYIDDLRRIIRFNRLHDFEGARLGPVRVAV